MTKQLLRLRVIYIALRLVCSLQALKRKLEQHARRTALRLTKAACYCFAKLAHLSFMVLKFEHHSRNCGMPISLDSHPQPWFLVFP